MRLIKLMLIILVVCFLMAGCARQTVISETNKIISKSYLAMQQKGMPSAKDTIRAWPYISGFLHGMLAEEFIYKMTPSVVSSMELLDKLAVKYTFVDGQPDPVISKEDSGMINGCVIRLEYLLGKELYKKYGVTIIGLVRSYIL